MKKHKDHKEDDDIIISTDSLDEVDKDVEIDEEYAHTESKILKIRKELKRCHSEKKEYLDGWQRAKADYVNVLRRLEEDKQKANILGIISAVKTLLPVLDSLERARSANEMQEGFDAIAKQIIKSFAILGVLEIPTNIGEAFNPSYHETLGQDKTDDATKDETISAILEKGWQINDTVIRPTKVRILRHI